MNWKFMLNDKEMSSFSHLGFSVPAFSGLPGSMNKCSSACLLKQGPIPPGTYFIVDRPTGGLLGRVRDWWSNKSDWLALFAEDQDIDDWTLCQEVRRGNFRLHPKGVLGISQGCITIENRQDFYTVRNMIMATPRFAIRNREFLAYGKVQVICGDGG